MHKCWVCVCFTVTLSKELQSLQRHYLICFYYLCPRGISDYSGSTFRGRTWSKMWPRSHSWPVDRPDKSEPLQLSAWWCPPLDPPASGLIKPCTALLYINLRLGLPRGILAFANESVALSKRLRKIQLIFPSWVKSFYKRSQQPLGLDARHWIIYHWSWSFHHTARGQNENPKGHIIACQYPNLMGVAVF